jgi:hypothetical protein
MISFNALRAPAWTLLGSSLRTFLTLWTQHFCSRVAGKTSHSDRHSPSAPSPTITTGARMPWRPRSRSSSAQSSVDSLVPSATATSSLVPPARTPTITRQHSRPLLAQADAEVHPVREAVHVVNLGEVALLEGRAFGLPLGGQPGDHRGRQSRRRAQQLLQWRDEVAGAEPCRYTSGSTSATFGLRLPTWAGSRSGTADALPWRGPPGGHPPGGHPPADGRPRPARCRWRSTWLGRGRCGAPAGGRARRSAQRSRRCRRRPRPPARLPASGGRLRGPARPGSPSAPSRAASSVTTLIMSRRSFLAGGCSPTSSRLVRWKVRRVLMPGVIHRLRRYLGGGWSSPSCPIRSQATACWRVSASWSMRGDEPTPAHRGQRLASLVPRQVLFTPPFEAPNDWRHAAHSRCLGLLPPPSLRNRRASPPLPRRIRQCFT